MWVKNPKDPGMVCGNLLRKLLIRSNFRRKEMAADLTYPAEAASVCSVAAMLCMTEIE